MKTRYVIPLLFLGSSLGAATPATKPTLPVTETAVARLAIVVVPNSLVVSPDSTRVALAAKAGDVTLADRGVFLDGGDEVNPAEDSAKAKTEKIRFWLDDHSGADFDQMSLAVFSPDSQHVGFAGLRDKHWHVVLDRTTVADDGDDTPPVPIAYAPDSSAAAWAIKRGGQYVVSVGEKRWPAITASTLDAPLFSPDSRHVAIAARRETTWALYMDGDPLPLPDSPTMPGRGAQPPHLARFTQLTWRPDSAALAYFGAFAGSSWQCFVQGADGKVLFSSPPFDDALGEPVIFSADGQHFAYAAKERKAWVVVLDGKPLSGAFEGLLPASLVFLDGEKNSAHLIYIVHAAGHWQLFQDGVAVGEPFDAMVQNTFIVSPDRRHFAFAAWRNHQTQIIRDGAVATTCQEASAATFAFSADSRHLAFAERAGGGWSACVDGTAGASFAAFGATPIAFSPDSSRIAYDASTGPKSWHLVVGQNAEQVSKPFDAFLKGGRVNWRADGTLVSIAIEKTVAMRIEAKP